jgi:hypothetical protein
MQLCPARAYPQNVKLYTIISGTNKITEFKKSHLVFFRT